MKSYGLSIPRDKFNYVYKYLYEKHLLRLDLKIISREKIRVLPILSVFKLEQYESEIFDFPLSHADSVTNILEEASKNLKEPINEKIEWYRLGKCIILKQWGNSKQEKLAALELVKKGKASAVYRKSGKITGEKRKPSIELLAGKGGEMQYIENGVRYIFDPEKIMISKGNLRERNYIASIGINPKNVLDMFSGIGYFSLPIGKYKRPITMTCLDVNEDALHYLKTASELNRISSKIDIFNQDCRSFHGKISYDLIVMGNFKSYSYLPYALRNTKEEGRLLLHIIVPTEKIVILNYLIMERIRKFGYRAIIENAHKVKSFSPHVWHMSVTILILQLEL